MMYHDSRFCLTIFGFHLCIPLSIAPSPPPFFVFRKNKQNTF